jgi:predicted Zn-dependent protease
MDHRWVPVHVEGRFTVLVRRDGPDGHLADRDAVEPDDLDTEAMIQHARSLDPAPGLALWLSAQVLTDLGWYDQALQLLAASRHDNPSESRAWIATANALTRRAMSREPRTTADLAAVRDDFEQVAEALQQAWELTGDPELAVNMGDVRQRLRQLDRQLAWVHQATSGVRP